MTLSKATGIGALIVGASVTFIGCNKSPNSPPAPGPPGPPYQGQCKHNFDWVYQCPYGTEAEGLDDNCSCVSACPEEKRCESDSSATNGCCPEGTKSVDDPCLCVTDNPDPAPTPATLDQCKYNDQLVDQCPYGTEAEQLDTCICVDACPQNMRCENVGVISGISQASINGCCPEGTSVSEQGPGSCMCQNLLGSFVQKLKPSGNCETTEECNVCKTTFKECLEKCYTGIRPENCPGQCANSNTGAHATLTAGERQRGMIKSMSRYVASEDLCSLTPAQQRDAVISHGLQWRDNNPLSVTASHSMTAEVTAEETAEPTGDQLD